VLFDVSNNLRGGRKVWLWQVAMHGGFPSQ